MERDLALLEDLTRAHGPSGGEGDVADILGDALSASGAKVARDEMGNLYADLPALREAAPTVAVVAHLDEVGLVIRHIRPDGFLLIDRIGGIGRRSLAGRHVILQGLHGAVDAVIGVQSHHLTDPSEYQKLPGLDKAFLDVGATSAAEAKEMGIEVGTRATFAASFIRLGRRDLCAKALDDRALCYAMAEVARGLQGNALRPRVLFIGSVREEFDFSGAQHIGRTLDAGFTIVLDVTPAVDTPDSSGEGVVLGSGPALKLQDFHGRGTLAGYIAPRRVVELVRKSAVSCGVELQVEVQTGVATDAAVLVAAVGAARLACLSLPIRYSHSPVECIRLSDLDQMISLVAELVIAAGEVVEATTEEEK